MAPEISRSPVLSSGTRYLQICKSRHCLRRRLPDAWKLACFVARVSASEDCLFCAIIYKCTHYYYYYYYSPGEISGPAHPAEMWLYGSFLVSTDAAVASLRFSTSVPRRRRETRNISPTQRGTTIHGHRADSGQLNGHCSAVREYEPHRTAHQDGRSLDSLARSEFIPIVALDRERTDTDWNCRTKLYNAEMSYVLDHPQLDIALTRPPSLSPPIVFGFNQTSRQAALRRDGLYPPSLSSITYSFRF